MIDLRLGDCLDVMAGMPENSVDTCITDPPYGIFFMSADWDHGVPGERFWKEALRVARPGAMLLAFGGTRTHHRLMVAIEDAGWQIRDTVMWVYGQGFPKSHDISKAIDKETEAEREVKPWRFAEGDVTPIARNAQCPICEKWRFSRDPCSCPRDSGPATDLARTWDGWGTALKPAWEPIILAMAPLDGTFAQNAEKWGVAGLWIDGGRVGTNEYLGRPKGQEVNSYNRSQYPEKMLGQVTSEPKARFPANLIHDGSDEVVGLFPQSKSSGGMAEGYYWTSWAGEPPSREHPPRNTNRYKGDSGSAARFFYCAKASRKERNAGCEGLEEVVAKRTQDGGDDTRGRPTPRNRNWHPTVKPLALMEYLCKLTRTPTGGIVLDPFMGSGSTGCACINTGRDFIGIELDPDYFKIAEARIAHAQREPQQAEMALSGAT